MFREELWQKHCEAYDMSNLRQLLVITRTGRRRPRPRWLRGYLEPLLAQVSAAGQGAGRGLREWAAAEAKLLNDQNGQRETPDAAEELEAEGAGVWAEFFLGRGLLGKNWQAATSALDGWALEASWGSPAGQAACGDFERGFLDAAAAHRARLVNEALMTTRAANAASSNWGPLWPLASGKNGSWLERRPWCRRLDELREERELLREQVLRGLRPRLAEAVRQHTGLRLEGNASLGFVFACRALYARNESHAGEALPCRMLHQVLGDIAEFEMAAAWRAQGDAAAFAAARAVRQLLTVLRDGNAPGPAQLPALPPRLHVWCADSVLLSALMGLLGLLADPGRPALAAPAASRLSVAALGSGAACLEYNGRPIAATASTEQWLRGIDRKLAAYNEAKVCGETGVKASGSPALGTEGGGTTKEV